MATDKTKTLLTYREFQDILNGKGDAVFPRVELVPAGEQYLMSKVAPLYLIPEEWTPDSQVARLTDGQWRSWIAAFEVGLLGM